MDFICGDFTFRKTKTDAPQVIPMTLSLHRVLARGLAAELYPAHKGLTLGVDPTRSGVIHRRAWLRGADHAGADDPGGCAAG